ncbi:MAG TPA: TonB-dependent copper receptor [Burkholderiaceae bacterium]
MPNHAARLPLAVACALLCGSPAAQAQDAATGAPTLREVVVTAVHDASPVTVVADPKQPRQPVPASDAADYLKTIPGFSAIRSGGSNSDPVFRGQFGSRLPILTNGGVLQGACPARMDSPSSYISPETYDQVTVVKGPQTVIWGPGASAGLVRFDRERPDLSASSVRFSGSLLGGSAGRYDQTIDLAAGNERYYGRVTANRSHGQDYKDGNGHTVPSEWDKWNADVALGFTPDADTLVELSAGTGNGEARYGGRGMDGTQFKRESAGLRFEKKNLSPWLAKLEAQLYYNDADHVMDNFTLRPFTPGGGMSMAMASNVGRTTMGARLAATVLPADHWQLVAGFDVQDSREDKRSGTPMVPYTTHPWERDAKFSNTGLFGEFTWHASEQGRLVGGLRLDHAQARRYAAASDSSGMMAMGMGGSGTAMAAANDHRSESALPSGFARWEQDLAGRNATVYAGVGHVQRFPDYWELISPGNSAATAGDAFNTLKPEKTTQIDVGAQWRQGPWQFWTSAYLGRVNDFILFDYASGSSVVRNVDADTAGFELGGTYRLAPAWSLQGTVAYSWARNASDHRPLPQIPPLDAKLGLDFAQGPWLAGALWRMVAAQHRYAVDEGNVVGRDFGPSAGFGVFSLHAGYAVSQSVKLTLGVDNLFDKGYAEHLNLAGNAGFGYPGTVAINEPGRTFWLRADVSF